MKFARTLALVTLLAGSTSPAWALGKGTSLLGLHAGAGQADWVDQPGTSGYLTAQPQLPEIQFGLDYWYMVSEHTAFTLAGGMGLYSETDKPGTAAAPGSVDQKSKINGFRGRVGMDHVFSIADNAWFYTGGGVEFGSAEFEYEAGTTKTTYPSVTRVGVHGRIGGLVKVSKSIAFGGQLGQGFGQASADDRGAKASWTTKWSDGRATMMFMFGGD